MLEAALIELCTAKLQFFPAQRLYKILGRSFAQASSKTSCLKKDLSEIQHRPDILNYSQKYIANWIRKNYLATLPSVLQKGFTSQCEMKRKALLTDPRVRVFDYAKVGVMSMFVVH